MSVQKLNIVDIDLNSGNIHRSWNRHSIGTADNKANAFGVRVFRDGAEESLSGVSVQGYFRDPRGNNIAITTGNTVDGNTAYVVLPQACYNYEGQFTLAIKLIGGGITGTVRIVDGMVDNTNTGGAVAPTETVPTYQEILATYDDMVDIVEDYEEVVANQDAQISDLKSAVVSLDETVNGETVKNFTSGKKLDSSNGSLVDDPTRCVSDKIPYTWTGSTRFYCGDNTTATYSICFYDASDNLLQRYQNPSSAGSSEYRNVNGENVTGTISYVRFDFKKNYTGKVCANVTALTPVYYEAQSTQSGGIVGDMSEMQDDIESLQEIAPEAGQLDAIEDDIEELQSLTLVERTVVYDIGNTASWTMGYVTKSGSIRSSDTLHYTNKISVQPGDIIKTTATNMRYVTAYVGETATQSLSGEDVQTYTVPDTVTDIIVTLNYQTTSLTNTRNIVENAMDQRVSAIEAQIDANGVSKVTANTVTNNTVTALQDVCIRKNMDIDFRGNVTSFTSVTIGHGYQINYGVWAVVDSTNVTIYADSGSEQKAQYPHGLTITHYIHVLIQQGDNTKATVIIESDSGRFRQEEVPFDSRRGDFFATVSGTMTDVSLSAVLHDLDKRVWMFGDSYQSIGDPKRYPYYLSQDGYINNCLMVGFPGAKAENVIGSFRKLVTTGRPKYVVWCMGMNGSDSGAINSNWKTYTDEMIATCAAHNITPVLATIPNVPDRDQTYKNAYVKTLTDYKYIDFAKAVGAESAGATWYNSGEEDAMLSNDNLHPSQYGAIALYSQLLADFPYIMQ